MRPLFDNYIQIILKIYKPEYVFFFVTKKHIIFTTRHVYSKNKL